MIQTAYHEALDKIEQLVQRKEAATDPQTIYSVIEYVCDSRSEDSIIQLMEYKAKKITPIQTQWLQELNSFMNRFFNMQNQKIRDESLQVLNRIMDNNKCVLLNLNQFMFVIDFFPILIIGFFHA